MTDSATRPRRSRAEAKARTRRQVLEAAEAVFRHEGYHGASLARIAEQAGFTTGAVYSTFDSKADVMLALLAERARQTQADTEALTRASTVEDFVAEIVRRGAERIGAERDWWAVVIEFMTVVARDVTLRARYAEHHEENRDAIARSIGAWMQRAGVSSAIPPRRLATALIAFGNGLTLEGLIAPAEVSEEVFATPTLLLGGDAFRQGEGGGKR